MIATISAASRPSRNVKTAAAKFIKQILFLRVMPAQMERSQDEPNKCNLICAKRQGSFGGLERLFCRKGQRVKKRSAGAGNPVLQHRVGAGEGEALPGDFVGAEGLDLR